MSQFLCSSARAFVKHQKITFPCVYTCSKRYSGLSFTKAFMGERSMIVSPRPKAGAKNRYSPIYDGLSRFLSISPLIRTRGKVKFFNDHSPVGTRDSSSINSFTEISLPPLDFTTMLKGPKAKFTVSIEGNIASGKSTMLNHFSKFTDVQVLQEPVDKWRDVRGYNLLDLMYKDPCRWAHTFQTYVQMTMLELHLTSCTVPVKLLERSLFSARYCFVENLFRNKMMSSPEYAVYCEWYKMITQNLDVGLDLIVYLRTDPSNLHERISQRSRNEEKTIPLQYLQDLHNLHEEWLIEKKYGLSTPVLVLDANDSLPSMYKKFEEHTSDILCQKLKPLQSEEENRQNEEEKVSPNSHIVATAN